MSKEKSAYIQLKSKLKTAGNRQNNKYFIFCTLSIVTAWFTWFKVLRGEFSIIDDHGLLPFIGPNHISPSEFFTLVINSTEIGQWGDSIRYRPVSIFLQFTQIIFFDNTAALYYLARLFIFVFTSFIFLKTTNEMFFGISKNIKLGAIIATALLFSILPAWGDILNRLGPSEIYEVLLLVMLLNYGFGVLMKPKVFGNYVAFLISGAVFYGTKEDALIGLPFSLLVAYFGFKYFPTKRIKILVVTLTNLGFGLFISLGVIIALSKNNGSDVYGNSRGLSNVFQFTMSAITSISTIVILTMWIVFGLLTKSIIADKKMPALGFKRLSILTVSVVTVWIWEHIFYSNNFGGSFNRYSIVSQVLLLFIALTYTSELCRIIIILIPTRSLKLERLVGLVIPTLIYFFTGPVHSQLIAINELRIEETIHLKQNLSKIEIASKSIFQVRLVSNQPGDYERIYSINKYLAHKEIFLPVYLDYSSEVENSTISFNESLDSQLRFMSKNGNSDWGIKPKLDAKKGPEICISFSQVSTFPSSCSQVFNVLEDKVE